MVPAAEFEDRPAVRRLIEPGLGLEWNKEEVELTPPTWPTALRLPEGYGLRSASLGGGAGGSVTLGALLFVGVTGEIAPGELALFVVLFVVVVGRQEVCTSHVEQLKLIA